MVLWEYIYIYGNSVFNFFEDLPGFLKVAAPFYVPAAMDEVSASHSREARVEVAYFLRASVSSAGLISQGRGED